MEDGKMKQTYILIIVFLLALASIKSVNAEVVQHEEAFLSAETEVLSSAEAGGLSYNYAEGFKRDFPSLRMKLKVTYKNEGNVPIVLYKKGTHYYGHHIAKTLEEAEQEKYEVDVEDDDFGMLSEEERKEPPISCFIVLEPGGTHSVEIELLVEVGLLNHRNTPQKGEYFLRIAFDPVAKTVGDELKKDLRKKGYYWDKSVVSKPMRFVIENN
jgi:hypothetical protein